MAKNQWGDEVAAPLESGKDWGDKPAAQQDLPAGVKPSTAGGGRGSVNPPTASEQAQTLAKRNADIAEMDQATEAISPASMPSLGNAAMVRPGRREALDERRTRSPDRVLDSDIPSMTPLSVARDALSGGLQIGPTIVKGVGDLTRLASLEKAGKSVSGFAERGTTAIKQVIGSERARQQETRFQQDMVDPALDAQDVISGNPGALADMVLPTVGSMYLPVGAANVAGRLASAGNAAKLAAAIDPVAGAARAATFSNAAVIGTTAAQNAADTYSNIIDKGGSQQDAYRGAAIAGGVSALVGKATGGGAEGQISRTLAGGSVGKGAQSAAKAVAKETGQEVGEQIGQSFGELSGNGEMFDANKFSKELAVAGTLGGVMGGGGHAASTIMQRADTRRPVEIRKSIDDTADDFAAEHGISSKAVQAARAKAETMPIGQVPGFYRKFFGALAGKTGRQIDETGFAGFDDLTDKLTPKPVTPINDTPAATMQSIAELESAQNPALAQSIRAQAATDSIAGNGGFDAGNDVVVTPETDAVHAAATSPLNDLAEPTKAQKDAGNYKMGRIQVAGMDIAIENPQGSVRRGVSQDGKPWETPMRHHYGYFNGTLANDGDKLDVFVQPGTPEDFKGAVYVVDQIDPATGALDEHKVLIGPTNEADARAMYAANYDSNWQGLGAITRLPLPAFKAWAKSGALKEPLGDIQIPQTAPATQTTTDPAPAPDTAALPVPAAAGGAPVNTGTAEQSNAPLNIQSNQPAAQEIRAQAAPESIAAKTPETADVVDLAAERARRNDALVELRKRHSVLVSLRKCMGG